MQDFYPVLGWGLASVEGDPQLFPTPLLDKNRFPNRTAIPVANPHPRKFTKFGVFVGCWCKSSPFAKEVSPKRDNLWELCLILAMIRKILAPIKIKSALPPPQKNPKYPKYPPLPKNEEFYGHGFFLQSGRIFPGVHKIGAAISGPRIADKILTDTRIFLT